DHLPAHVRPTRDLVHQLLSVEPDVELLRHHAPHLAAEGAELPRHGDHRTLTHLDPRLRRPIARTLPFDQPAQDLLIDELLDATCHPDAPWDSRGVSCSSSAARLARRPARPALCSDRHPRRLPSRNERFARDEPSWAWGSCEKIEGFSHEGQGRRGERTPAHLSDCPDFRGP